MMKYLNITGTLLLLLTVMASCVRDGADPCPVGAVKLNIFAENFANMSEEDPLASKDDKFYETIKYLEYYLYKDGEFIEKFSIPLATGSSNYYPLALKDLPYGEYEIAFVANNTKGELLGDPTRCSNLILRYPGSANTQDYFTWIDNFTINSENEIEKEIGLMRTHGIIRYTFKNMPSFINKFRVTMGDVYYERRINIQSGTRGYENKWDMNRTFDMQTPIADDEPYYASTFPTMRDKSSAAYVYLYQEGDEENPYFSKHVGDTLIVKRNHLLDITATYNNGDVKFEVKLDTEWNGSAPGSTGEID